MHVCPKYKIKLTAILCMRKSIVIKLVRHSIGTRREHCLSGVAQKRREWNVNTLETYMAPKRKCYSTKQSRDKLFRMCVHS